MSCKDKKTRVLILGDDERMMLPIVRSLSQRNVLVHAAWCSDDNPVHIQFT